MRPEQPGRPVTKSRRPVRLTPYLELNATYVAPPTTWLLATSKELRMSRNLLLGIFLLLRVNFRTANGQAPPNGRKPEGQTEQKKIVKLYTRFFRIYNKNTNVISYV